MCVANMVLRLSGFWHGWQRRHIRAALAASALAVTSLAVLPVQVAGASSLTSSDGYTSLSTIGTVTTGAPYSSGQGLELVVQPNSVISGTVWVEECTDSDGSVANLPTGPSNCEAATLVGPVPVSGNGGFSLGGSGPAFTVYDLPDPGTLGIPTMTGKCDVAPNECVFGLFESRPNGSSGTAAFAGPHLFSAPFQVTVGDGTDLGDNPGDGTPETPYVLALPLLAFGLLGLAGLRLRRRRTTLH
jgi:hypothetical protein